MRTTPLVTGLSTAFVLIGLLTACGKGPTGPTVPTNRPPGGGSVTVTPSAVGMAGVTTFSFDSNASDEDRDQLTYDWNFGDGVTGTGKTPTHIYAETGTFGVTLRVSDGKAEPVSATGVSVTVAPSITGTWAGGRHSFSNCGLSFTVTQNGDTLAGSFSFTEFGLPLGRCSSHGSVTLDWGAVIPLTYPSAVTWTSNVFTLTLGVFRYPTMTLRFTGTTNTAGNIVSGTLQTQWAGGASSETTTFTK